MITRFGSLFAGHVDLDDHGLDATPVNDRWLPDERLVTVFAFRGNHEFRPYGGQRLAQLFTQIVFVFGNDGSKRFHEESRG